MAVIDKYTGLVVAPGKSPSTNKDGVDYNYLVTMDPGDVLTLCIANMDGLTIQNTAAGDISLEQSNYLCTIIGPVVIGGNPIEGNITNPNTVFAPVPGVATTTEVINAMDVTAIQQMRITAVNATEVSITISDEAPENVGFIVATSGGSAVTFDTIEDRQRQDDTVAGKVEYTKTVSTDSLGVETVLTTTNPDGTPYVPTGTEEFNPIAAGIFDVVGDDATFKVNGGGYGVLLENTVASGGDGTVFFDDDNDIQGKGIVLSIPENIILNSNIADIQWVIPGGGYLTLISENASVGATGATDVERLKKTRIFLKTHEIDQITPVGVVNSDNDIFCTITTQEGISFAVCFKVGIPVFNVTRKIQNVASGNFQVTQDATPTAALVEFITWQPNKLDCSVLADWTVNTAPTTGSFEIVNTPCGTVLFTTAGLAYNPIEVCDQGGEYTFSLVTCANNPSFQPIGTDSIPTGLPYYVIGGLVSPIPSTVFSYDKN